MAYVISQNCCNDASCIAVCPVDCIRPTPDERDAFAAAEMLYIDPDTCIDCGACEEVCPVGAISFDEELPDELARFAEFNAGYFVDHPLRPSGNAPRPTKPDRDRGGLSVAVVGAGPSGAYVAEELLSRGNTAVTILDSLPTPWGLLRSGVAPDHQDTKALADLFERTADKQALDVRLNATAGTDVTVAELMDTHHAVVLATGAADARAWHVPGHELPGVHSAAEFVAWYNGHPEYADRTFDLSGERVVIVGNGNVALDMARVLTTPGEELEKTDLACHALDALRASRVSEVVVTGRRGALQAAYTTAEFHALTNLDGVDIVVDPGEAALDDISRDKLDRGEATYADKLKVRLAQEYAAHPPGKGRRRIVFRYFAEPTRVAGDDRVESVELTRTRPVERDGAVGTERTTDAERIETGLILTSVGYRGRPVPGVPFDGERGVIPDRDGRVVDQEGAVCPRLYTTGWIRRGARGGLGASRLDAAEVAERIATDFNDGTLDAALSPAVEPSDRRYANSIDLGGWRRIDRREKDAGAETGRPRVKLVSTAELVSTALEEPS